MTELLEKIKNETEKRIGKNRYTSGFISHISSIDLETLYATLNSDKRGLSEEEVESRQDKFGKNEVAHEKSSSWYRMLYTNLVNPFVILLVVLGLVSYFTDDLRATIVVSVMVVVSVLMRFIQEFRSSKAAEKLKSMVNNTATVTRQTEGISQKIEIPFKELVPGDIVHLSAGDMVPADVRLTQSKDLFISQSVLTGESLPVEKYAFLNTMVQQPETLHGKMNGNHNNPMLESNNICFMGTNVVSGSGIALVAATGSSTYFGSMSKSITGRRSMTSFDIGVNKVTFLLIRFILIMVPVIFLINGFAKHDWRDAFLFAIAVAVGLTPEMLPMVVTANLARGALAMSKKKVIVKRLNAIQNFGAINILCTDKTGTLTQDKIILERHINIFGETSEDVLKFAFLNSYHQTGLKNLLDRAVLEHTELHHQLNIAEDYRMVDEIPFDFVRRRMTVVVEKEHNQNLFICKGAVEEILNICNGVETGEGNAEILTDELRNLATDQMNKQNEDGFRVVAVAYKKMPPIDRPYSVQDEQNLILSGFITFLDPPKETAGPAIQALKNHGVAIKVLTGDNDVVTRKICKEVGLDARHIITGNEINDLDDKELGQLAERTVVFAKLNPMQKTRIIQSLRELKHTVGYLGDGINDAGALRAADVGISVDTAADIAKESADIIMLEKSLMVLEEGILRGREVFGNIMKYIKMTTSSNFGNVFSVLIASIFLPFLPMLPVQLLVQNLLYDFSQLSIPWDRMDEEFVRRPRKWDPGSIARFMVFIGPISSVFDITTFFLMWYFFKANSMSHQNLFQSGWFIEGLLSQTLIVHMIRTRKIPFVNSTASLPVLVLTGVIMLIGIAIPFTPLGHSISLVPLPPVYFIFLIVTLAGYYFLTQVVKNWYIKKFHSWL
ncbi:MAG: magnesium-translocating P-type ATPase [Chitinophagaceae bacterium]|nr:MAG: magnesium-translocating P-type ATPase [Chitinophagaceae bacterium]